MWSGATEGWGGEGKASHPTPNPCTSPGSGVPNPLLLPAAAQPPSARRALSQPPSPSIPSSNNPTRHRYGHVALQPRRGKPHAQVPQGVSGQRAGGQYQGPLRRQEWPQPWDVLHQGSIPSSSDTISHYWLLGSAPKLAGTALGKSQPPSNLSSLICPVGGSSGWHQGPFQPRHSRAP